MSDLLDPIVDMIDNKAGYHRNAGNMGQICTSTSRMFNFVEESNRKAMKQINQGSDCQFLIKWQYSHSMH